MKSSLKLAALFFIICVCGTIGGALFVMLNYDLTILVAGNDVSFFSADFFVRAVFAIFPFMCLFALILLILYMIRHPARPLPLLLGFAAVSLVTWAVLLPLHAALSLAYEDAPLDAPVPDDLSPGYFREYNGNVYFYARTFRYSPTANDLYGEGLMIDLSGIRGKAGEIYPFSTSVTVKPQNAFTDVIFMNAAKMPAVVAVPVAAYNTLREAARYSWQGGIIPWIAFAFLGGALFSIVCLRGVSAWRFLNASVVSAAAVLVIAANALLYSHRFFSDVSIACADVFFDLGYYLPDVLSGVARIREPLALFVNSMFILVFVLIGLLTRLVRKHRSTIAVYAEEDDA